jgi:hypothetical protein
LDFKLNFSLIKTRIELIIKDWVKLKTGIELSDKTISKLTIDIVNSSQCNKKIIEQLAEIEANAKNVLCPELLCAMNQKYRELQNEINTKNI